MRSAVRIATITAASLALAVGGATAASAESGTIKDKRDDVVFKGKVSGDRTSAQKAFAKRIDVTSVKVTHGSKYVSFKINFAELRSTDEKSVKIEVAKKSITNNTGTVTAFFELYGKVSEPRGFVDLYSREDKEVCGIAADVDGDALITQESYIKTDVKTGKNGFYKMQVPRSCLDNESKIKVRTSVFNVSEEGRSFKDFVSPSKAKTPAWSEWVLKD